MDNTPPLPDMCADALRPLMQPEMFKALSEPMRLSIIAYLATQNAPVTVGAVSQCCGIDFSGVSRHLKILREAGLLNAQKDGRQMLYALEGAHLAGILRAMADGLERCQTQASL